ARFTPDNSPRSRTWPKRSSTIRFSRPEISVIESGAALSPARPLATSPPPGPSPDGPPAWESRLEGVVLNILLLGSGGREHALAWKLAQSRLLANGGTLFAAPGNPGIADHARIVELDVTDHGAVAAFCEEQAIGLVVIGPEAPLVDGLAD